MKNLKKSRKRDDYCENENEQKMVKTKVKRQRLLTECTFGRFRIGGETSVRKPGMQGA